MYRINNEESAEGLETKLNRKSLYIYFCIIIDSIHSKVKHFKGI